MTTLFIDADACPVKAEAERVASGSREGQFFDRDFR